MAGKYGASDLGSDWITVPRKFRGRKPTSSDTELAYITGAEKGLLSRFANANQVGPSNIPSYDDSGFEDPTYYTTSKGKKSTQKIGGYSRGAQAKAAYKPPTDRAMIIGNKTRAVTEKQIRDREMSQAPGSQAVTDLAKAVKRADRYKALTKGGPGTGGGKTDIMSGPEFHKDDDDRWKNVPEGDGGDTTTTDPCQGRGRNPDGSCKTTGDTTTEEDKCKGKDLSCSDGSTRTCDPKTGKTSACPTTKECPHGADGQGNCLPKPGGDEDGDGTPSLTTINQPDQTPMLQELTSDMDLRNMLGNVLNKNNPLFKQARTRALQAMAGRGIVNSSMAEEAVMGAIMDVAIPIATRVIDDLQRVMAANVNASNAFKEALNQAYYTELLHRIDAANEWNLTRMQEGGFNWRAMLEAKGGAANISDPEVYRKYMEMLKGQPGFNIGTPTYDVAGT